MNIPESLMTLRAAYPSQDIPDSTLKLFAAELEDLEPADVEQSIHVIIKGSRWFPTVADIREQVDALNLRRAEIEWEQELQRLTDERAAERALNPPEPLVPFEEWAEAHPEEAARLERVKVLGLPTAAIIKRNMENQTYSNTFPARSVRPA